MMTKAYWESKFLDYLEGTLSKEEVQAFEMALNADPALKKSFEEYRQVLAVEAKIADESFALSPNFSVSTMNLIEKSNSGFFERLKMYLVSSRVLTRGAISALATVVVVLYLGRNQTIDNLREEVVGTNAPSSPTNYTIGQTSGPEGQAREYNNDRISDSKEALKQYVKGTLGLDAGMVEHSEVKKELAKKSDKDKRVAAEPAPPASASGSGSAVRDIVTASGGNLDRSKSSLASSAQSGEKDEAKQKEFQARTNEVFKRILERQAAAESKDSRTKTESGLHDQMLARKIGRTRRDESEYGGLAGSESVIVEEQPKALPEPIDRLVVPPSNTEHYNNYSENKPTLAADEGLSTFSLDVDTGSYSNARRFLQQGITPPPDSVRIEEFINYFKFNYPAPSNKPFAVSYELAPSPLDKGKFLLKIGVKAQEVKVSESGWNLVFLVDVSGSMAPSNKLPLVQRALKVAVQNMRARDRIAIVTYAGQAGLKLDSTSGSDKNKINSAIDNLSAGGSTNGSGGIELAYQVAQRNVISGGVNRVVLATDGDFNVGITSFDALIKLIEAKREQGITLTTLGFGEGNYQEATMEQLADKGNGNYFYIDSFTEARKVLETDLLGNMQIVAKDVKAQVEFNPQHVKQYRLIGYDNRKLNKEDFNNDRIDAGEVGSGHTVTALYELVLNGTDAAKNFETEYRYKEQNAQKSAVVPGNLSSELGFIKIRYKEPQASDSKLMEFPIAKDSLKSDSKMASNDFRFSAAVAYFGSVLRKSQYGSNYALSEIIDLAQGALGEDPEGLRREFVGLVKNIGSMVDPNPGPCPEAE